MSDIVKRYTVYAVADAFGVSPGSIRQNAKTAGIKTGRQGYTLDDIRAISAIRNHVCHSGKELLMDMKEAGIAVD